MNVWILTRAINEYDQDGEYFVAAFKEKPTTGMLRKYRIKNIQKVLDGGGREGVENEWFYLRKINL